MSCEDCLSRRAFLAKSTFAVAGVAALAAGCGDGQIGGGGATGPLPTGLTLKVSTVPALATAGVLTFHPQDLRVAIKRTGPSSFLALSTACTHEGTRIDIVNGAQSSESKRDPWFGHSNDCAPFTMSIRVPSWVHAVDSARKLVGPLRLIATRTSCGWNASTPAVANAGTVDTLSVSPAGSGPVAPAPPIWPSPHPAVNAATLATASVLLARNARRLRQSSQLMLGRGKGGRFGSGQHDDGVLPLRQVAVFLIELVDVDGDGVADQPHGVAVHATRRASFDERTVRAILRLVLWALEAVVAPVPPERRVLVRTGEREREHRLAGACEDHLVRLVDLHTVRGGDGIRPLDACRRDRA